ncbi:hypothetical protein [Methylobacterium sp. Leaf456]|nr:hypothetical protein [Methylobacterium sp. Leaf456]
MASKVLLVLTVLVLLIDGHAPRMREIRNPDAEGGGRPGLALKRADRAA